MFCYRSRFWHSFEYCVGRPENEAWSEVGGSSWVYGSFILQAKFKVCIMDGYIR